MRSLIAAALLLLGACATQPGPGTPATVPAVDLARYAGAWYEIARLPNSFQDGGGRTCEGTIATYEARADGTIGVTNRCLDRGEERIARASAYAVPGSGNGRLRVSFFWPFYGDYWVIGLDPEYRWAVVGSPGRKLLWLLSRTPAMAPADRAAAEAIARAQGFDVARLRPTLQPGS
jgi:apolipoprotein D and lipocalin family protein